MMGRWVRKWPVEGHSGNAYVVAVDEFGTYGCSCPRWKFHRAECDHIRAIKIRRAVEETAEKVEMIVLGFSEDARIVRKPVEEKKNRPRKLNDSARMVRAK